MEPFEIMISESQERMLCVVEPEQARRGARGLREVGGPRHRDRRRHRHAPPARAARRRDRRRHARRGARRRLPAVRPRAGEPREPVYAAPAAGSPATRRPRTRCSRCWLGEHRLEALGVRAVRHAGRLAHGAPPGGGDAAVLSLEPDGGSGAIAVAIDGNGRRVACDPFTGAVEAVLECAQNLACAGRRAARPDQLPELRQPREAAHRLAVRRARSTASRRLHRARRAGHRGQRVALQRGPRGPDLPDAGRRHGRQARRPGPVPRLGFASGRRDPARRAVRAGARRIRSSRSSAAAARSLPAVDLAAHARALAAVRASGPPDGARLLHPRRLGRRARDRAGRVLDRERPGGRGPGRGRPEAALFGEGPGGVLLAGPREDLEGLEESLRAARFSDGRRDGRRPARHHGRRCYALRCRWRLPQEAHDGSLPSRFE